MFAFAFFKDTAPQLADAAHDCGGGRGSDEEGYRGAVPVRQCLDRAEPTGRWVEHRLCARHREGAGGARDGGRLEGFPSAGGEHRADLRGKLDRYRGDGELSRFQLPFRAEGQRYAASTLTRPFIKTGAGGVLFC